MTQNDMVTAAAAYDMLIRGEAVEIIDVREREEYRDGHVEPSRLIPLGELPRRLAELDRSKTLLMLCRSGSRSALAARQLAGHGFDVRNIQGGMLAWAAGKLPVVQGD